MDRDANSTMHSPHKRLEIEVPIVWDYVRQVRRQVEAALAHVDEEQRSASVMVASELLENAIKYGTAVPNLPHTRFTMECGADAIKIRVENGVIDDSIYAAIRQLVESMTDESVCAQLYLARIQALIENPFQPNRLGLYRIGYEGKFSLACSYEHRILTMLAQRTLP